MSTHHQPNFTLPYKHAILERSAATDVYNILHACPWTKIHSQSITQPVSCDGCLQRGANASEFAHVVPSVRLANDQSGGSRIAEPSVGTVSAVAVVCAAPSCPIVIPISVW